MLTPHYQTVVARAIVEIKIEKSLFIGHASEAPSIEVAKAFVADVREVHREATHNCYAYRVGSPPADVTYFNDHGEPAGTAGKPILGAIMKKDLTDVVVVVTRYFGGKKLGVRGLIEAYGQTATAVLDKAGVRDGIRLARLRLVCSYHQLQHVTHLVTNAGGTAVPEFGADIVMDITLPVGSESHLNALLDAAGLPTATPVTDYPIV